MPIDFEDNLNQAGGVKLLARENYSRNLWAIMSKFNVLPTDERFLNLTNPQISFLLESMEIDAVLASGKNLGDYVEDDSFDYEGEMELPSEEEQKDVWEQIQSMTPDRLRSDIDDKLAAANDEPEENLVLNNLMAGRQRRLRALGLDDTDNNQNDPLLDDEEIDTL